MKSSGTPSSLDPTDSLGTAGGGGTTVLLRDARAGSREAVDALFSLTYEELRRLAHSRLAKRNRDQTLSTTALVHEAYIRLVDQTCAQRADREHFLALASRAMRFVLIDYLRARRAQKRGAAADAIPIDEIQVAVAEPGADLLLLDEALERLFGYDERLARLVEYRFFGGLTYDDIAEVTGRSVPTVKRDWVRARTWLYGMMSDAESPGPSGVDP